MLKLSFREGDFIETCEGLIFDVKGLVHPPKKVIAFVRYIPSPVGNLERDGFRYRKIYDLTKRFAFLRKNFPKYLVYDPIIGEELVEVPIERIVRHYQPIQKLVELRFHSNLDFLETKVLEIIDFLNNSTNTPNDKIGISGSILVRLASSSSDLDLIVYGVKNARTVNNVLRNQLKESNRFRKYDIEKLKALYRSRCKARDISFEDYVFHERRKLFQGLFDGIEFFIRYVKDWGEFDETYGENIYASIGRTKVSAVVNNSSDAIFTPCFYKVEDVEVIEGTFAKPILGITSFRGRFCQQAFSGEQIIASGKLERVTCNSEHQYRLVLGGHPEDFMVTVR